MKNLSLFFIALMTIAILSSCNKEESAKLNVHLTDAPGDYEALYLNVQSVEINISGENNENWLALDVNPSIVNLLDLTNGLDTILGTADLTPGKVSQIRLILGENCKLVTNGQEYSLDVPSGETSGLKLNVNEDFLAGVTYDMWLDFDAARSIVKNVSGYKLKPVIRVFTEATSGAISGVVLPTGIKPYVFAVQNGDTIGTIADESGSFLLKGIPEGKYNLNIDASDSYQLLEIKNIEVRNGEIVDLDTLNLVSK